MNASAAFPDGRGTWAPPESGIRKVLLAVDARKQGVLELVDQLKVWLGERVDSVEVDTDVPSLDSRRAGQSQPERPDLIVVLGGDGMMLGVARAFAKDPVPTLGINFGRLGFLASTPASNWREVLESVFEGKAIVEPRMRLRACFCPKDGDNDQDWEADESEAFESIVLNEVTLQRGAHQGILSVALHVGDAWVSDYRADGLILSTPTGSTAHSLSAGGPILAPSMDALVVTPMCPVGLSYRPLVMHPGVRVRMVVTESSGLTTLVLDGQGFVPMARGSEVWVERHPEAYPLLVWEELDPYRRLRERLGWSQSLI